MNTEVKDVTAEYLASIRNGVNKPAEKHPIPALGGIELWFRYLNGIESDALQVEAITKEGKIDFQKLRGHRAKVVSMCVITPPEHGGSTAFSQGEVCKWDNEIISECFEVCQKMNKLGAKEGEKAGED